MRVLMPSPELKFFGFRECDINNLQNILSSDLLNDFIELETIEGQLFDFGSFVAYIISNSEFRKAFIESVTLGFNGSALSILRYGASMKPYSLILA